MPVSTLYRQLHSRLTAREPMPPKVALIRQDASPAQASRETFDLICRSLSGSAIPFFCVRPMRGRPPVIAVRASYRQRAITSLARHGLYSARLPGGRHKVNELGKVRQLRRSDMGDAKAIRLWLYYASPSRTLTLGPESGVDVEFWSREGELLVAPRPNRVCEAVPVQEEIVDAPETPVQPARLRQRAALSDAPGVRLPAGRRRRLPDRRGLHLGRRERPGLAGPQGAGAHRRACPTWPRARPGSSAATSCATRCGR